MRHVLILIPKDGILGSIEGPRQLLTQVNQFCQAKGGPPLFDVKLVGLTQETPISGGCFTVHSDLLLTNTTQQANLIIIPAVDGDLVNAVASNQAFIPWLKTQYEGGAEIASLCMGAFLLASTGLLDGKKCATHWLATNQFRQMFPDVNLIPEQIITDELGLYSSGGAYSYLNLILYLIEKYAGRDIAILCAKVFAIEFDRESQSPFTIFERQKEHEDEPVKKAQAFIEANFQDRISVDQLASEFALGRRNLERRFKKATANTVVEYIQRVKVEAAKKNFETSRKTITEVMYDVGYSDNKAFRLVFKKITGLSPIDYRNKYNKERISA
jgi:transcriptional regulator GlxA family with amidase domain